jgi:formate dehydrogenase iron-sulfur subunit
MGEERTLQIKAISGHPGSVPGKGMQREVEVCKLVDTTTCIGCKACEVACVEWNDLPFGATTFDNTYQTMPETRWNYWNLIKFNEHQKEDSTLMWLMRKDQCMHCEDPGCLAACPADGAIVQYENGIVDFQQENCIGCQLCMSGCPFDIPKFNQTTKKVYKCSLCSDRVGNGLEPACIKACPTGCLQFGSKQDMKEAAEHRAKQLRDQSGFADAGVWDPQSIGGTHVIYVLHDAKQPELYGGLPANPRIPVVYTWWKPFLKPLSLLSVALGAVGIAFHYVGYGPKPTQPEPPKHEGKEDSAHGQH